jgi:hypothetical protein
MRPEIQPISWKVKQEGGDPHINVEYQKKVRPDSEKLLSRLGSISLWVDPLG